MRIRPLTASAAALTGSVLVVGVLAVSGSQAATTKTVKVDDYSFSPKTLTVKKGTKVKWVWVGQAEHDVEVTSGPGKDLASKVMTRGTYSRTFKKAGVYKIDCSLHSQVMKMVVKVK
jgi:plastocyanin